MSNISELGATNTPRWYALNAISDEVSRALEKHGNETWSRHEFYAILLEEVEELWEEIKRDGPSDNVWCEAVQVAAMIVRYLETSYDRDLERYENAGGHN